MTDFVLQEKTKNNCIFINLLYALRVMQVFMTTRVCKLSDSHLFYLILKKKKVLEGVTLILKHLFPDEVKGHDINKVLGNNK